MNILVIGNQANLDECKEKFGETHRYTLQQDHHDIEGELHEKDVVFDFSVDDDPYQVEAYTNKPDIVFFLNTTKISLTMLSNLVNHQLPSIVYGFNGLPTFLNREVLEVCSLNHNANGLQSICEMLNTKYLVVDDRVGLVTPRIICMIINEAYYTVQEGTASREDIDKAMKLGTNYPYGPFEWCDRIGVHHVYELLEALHEDTRDERYKICPLLKKEYLKL